jgi:hypothetical protein
VTRKSRFERALEDFLESSINCEDQRMVGLIELVDLSKLNFNCTQKDVQPSKVVYLLKRRKSHLNIFVISRDEQFGLRKHGVVRCSDDKR